jgi:hypothetical protein
MSFGDNLQYRVENWSLYFQGGVRRSVLIFAGVCLAALAPAYFFGQFTSNILKTTWYNDKNFVIPKSIQILDYEVSQTQIVPLINNQNELYVSVNNKTNQSTGYFPWIYTLKIYDPADQLVSAKTYSSYLLPNEIKYVVTRAEQNKGSRVELVQEPQTTAVQYNPLANSLLKNPNITIRSQNVRDLDNKNLEIFALFKNNDQVRIETVDVLFIIRDTRQSVTGIGQYQFNGFVPGEEREIRLTYPKAKDREAKFLDIRWSVNYLDKNNIRLGS